LIDGEECEQSSADCEDGGTDYDEWSEVTRSCYETATGDANNNC